jgi:hypothetical protein
VMHEEVAALSENLPSWTAPHPSCQLLDGNLVLLSCACCCLFRNEIWKSVSLLLGFHYRQTITFFCTYLRSSLVFLPGLGGVSSVPCNELPRIVSVFDFTFLEFIVVSVVLPSDRNFLAMSYTTKVRCTFLNFMR